MRKGLAVLGALVISLLAISGCGDSDSSLSQAEYKQQLEIVCNTGLRERAELVSEVTREFEELRERKSSPQYEAENLKKLAATYEHTTEEIDDLGLPDQNPKQAEELIQTREEAAAKVLADPLGARGNLEPIFEDANQVAEQLGVKSCSM